MNFGTFIPAAPFFLMFPPHYIGRVWPDPRIEAWQNAPYWFFALGPFSDSDAAASNIAPCTGVAYELVNGRATNLQPAIKLPQLRRGAKPSQGEYGSIISYIWALQSDVSDAQIANIIQVWNQNSPSGNGFWETRP